MIESGIGFATRKAAILLTPTVTITKNGDKYTMKTETKLKTTEFTFELGKEFDEARQDGKTVKAIITMDGNKMIHKQTDDKPVEMIREFSAEGMNVVATCGSVSCTRFYSRTK